MSNVVVGETLAPATISTVLTTTTVKSDDTVVIVRTVALLILLILSLIGNSLIVLSFAQARSSRYFPFNAFILSMAAFGLLECTLTMSLATGFSIEKQWKFGSFLAGFNASFIQLQNVGVVLTIFAMSVDRYMAVTRLTTYRSQPSVHKANYVVLYTWIHAFIFSLPLLFQNQDLGITCRAFVERCLCALEEGTSLIFTVLMFNLCFSIPLILVIVFLCLVRRKASIEKSRVKSMNSADYSAYCMQESMLLKEARLCRYVTFVFVLFLLFKMPYVIIDALTQLQFQVAFESVASGGQTLTVDGSRFYFQTAIAWLMFCYSAIFPYFTFVQFPDHWRNMKRYLTCAPVTASAANNLPLSRNQRQLRQIQRRLRRHQKKVRRNARKKNRASVSTLPTGQSAVPPSTLSTNITSERITVNRSSSGGEVTFRVPVLYAATDGLHLVASHKVLPTGDGARTDDPPPLRSNPECSPSSRPSDAAAIGQPSGDVIDDARPSSVVDKRVDVTGSRDCLQSDDDVYLQSDVDSEESNSELNESANSRTLIWPSKHRRETKRNSDLPDKPPKFVWQEEDAPNGAINSSADRIKQGSSNSHVKELDDPPHPHTPSPPPDEEHVSGLSGKNSRDSSSSIHDHLVEKIRTSQMKLPALRGDGRPLAFPKHLDSLARREKLIKKSRDEIGLCNDGYESATSCSGSDYSVVIRDTSHPQRPPKPRFFLSGPQSKRNFLSHSTSPQTSQSSPSKPIKGLSHPQSGASFSPDVAL